MHHFIIQKRCDSERLIKRSGKKEELNKKQFNTVLKRNKTNYEFSVRAIIIFIVMKAISYGNLMGMNNANYIIIQNQGVCKRRTSQSIQIPH